MKLIKPSFEIISSLNGEEMLKQIEIAARTCYKSEGKIEIVQEFPLEACGPMIAVSARKLISKLIANGHEAMLEFSGNITVKFICDRGVSHELVRHRVASFAQESTRYCNYGNENQVTFILPNWLKEDHTSDNPSHSYLVWYDAMLDAEDAYLTLIRDGWQAQQARSVLPNSVKTEINVSTNVREWRHIFKLRTAKTAHPQMREVMQPLLDEFKKRIPILFDDITY